MKKRLLSYILFTFLCFLAIRQQAFAQATASFTYLPNGVTDGANPYTGTSAVVFGFSVNVGGTGSITFSKYYIGVNNGSATSAFANATLVRCTSSTYSAGASTPVGSVTMSGGTGATAITIDNLTETISTGNTNYYFLVVDVLGTNYTYCQLYSNNSQIATDNAGTNYNSGGGFSKYVGNNFSNNSSSTNIPLRITPETGGLTSNTNSLVANTSGVAMFGFSLTGSGTYNMSQIYINSNISTLSQYFNGFTLYTTGTTASYSVGGRTAVPATITTSGSYVSIAISGTNLQATTTQKYYWLVANVNSSITGTIPANPQFSISSGQTNTAFTSSGGNCNTVTIFGPSYNINYAIVNMAALPSGLTSTTVYPGQTDVAAFGFSLATSSGSAVITAISINSDNASLSSYYNNFRLYSNTTNDYSTGTKTLLGTVSSATGSFINFSTLNQNQTLSSTAQYYFLVADVSYSGTGTNSTTFKFVSAQSSAALTQSSPATTYNNFNVSGSTYNITQPTITMVGNSNGAGITGLNSGNLYYGTTGTGVYGVKITVTGVAVMKGIFLTDQGGITQSSAFANIKLYASNSAAFDATNLSAYTLLATGSTSGSTVTFSGFTDKITNATRYYIVVVDDIYFSNSGNNQYTLDQYTTASGTTNLGSSKIFSTYYNFSQPSVTIANNSNGITPGNLSFGQTNIVLLGFSIAVQGGLTFNTINIHNSGIPGGYFSNARLYRSTSSTFTGGSPLYTSSAVAVSSSTNFTTATITETIKNTTYYYWLVADYTVSTGAAGTFQTGFNVNTTQSPVILIANSPSFSTNNNNSGFNNSFTMVNSVVWVGGTAGATADLTNAGNYKTLAGGTVGSSPAGTNSSTNVIIGRSAITTAPSINVLSTVELGKITFDPTTVASPTLSLTLGSTLKLNGGLIIMAGSSPTINGGAIAGTLNLPTGSVSDMASTSRLTLGANLSITNSGTFTLNSDASGTASIAAIPSTSNMQGTYIVERYFTGGTLANRGYRLLSFPVNTTSTRPVTTSANSNFTSFKTNLLITGPGGSGSGWDQPSGYTANGPTILIYNTATNSFNNPALTTLSATTINAGQGFYFYFRGDNQNNLTNKVVKSGTYATPESNIVGLQTGTLNQQGFTYNLSSTAGYNLVGNPYPSSITIPSGTSALTGNATQFVYTYTSGGSSVTSHALPWQVASGQGFFVRTTGSGATVVFSESLKSTGQPTLLMGTPATTVEGNIQLQMVQDSANYDYAQLRFLDTYDKNYIDTEDADDFNGSGQVVFFGAMTADNHLVGIASQPLDRKSTSVFLSVNDNTSGTFKINRIDLSNIPDKFDVRLIDHFKNDSLDLRKDSTYTFTIDKNNAATYGNSRMEVVIRLKVLPPYQLLTFTGKRNGNNNVLNWTTKNEYTYTSFALERSYDNKTFEGVNNSVSTGTGSYTFTDQTSKPLVYYRLKQTDINENETYSAVVILKSDDGNALSVYPNPTVDILHFAITQDVKTSITLRVYNSMGTLMKIKTYTSNSGDQDVSNLTPGGYMAEIVDDSTKKLIASAKFIKL